MDNIKSESLKKYLEFLLNKSDYSSDDFDNVNSVTISGRNIKHEPIEYSIADIKNFNNLKKLIVSYVLLTKEDINIIVDSNLKELSLIGCTIEDDVDLSVLNGINILEFSECLIEDYGFLNSLEHLNSLHIINPVDNTDFDISQINDNCNMIEIVLNGCEISNIINLNKYQTLTKVSLLNSTFNLEEIIVLEQLHNLNKLELSKEIANTINLQGVNIISDIREKMFIDE